LSAPAFTGSVLAYDAENRLSTAPGVQYAYDSQNKRVWAGTLDSHGNLTTQTAYFFGADGPRMGTYTVSIGAGNLYLADPPARLEVYFAGKRVAITNASGMTSWFQQDRLGSNTAGNYYPWGEDRGTPAANDQVKFATYTRDSATLLDYADNRYYTNAYGRFMTPDPYKNSGRLDDPQSWNRYAYTGGDPVNRTDARGTDWNDCGDGWETDASLSGPCGGSFTAQGPYGTITIDIGAIITGTLETAGLNTNDSVCYGDNYGLAFGSGGGSPYSPPGYNCNFMQVAQRARPSYLRIVDDCYVAGSIAAGHAQRNITYQLVNDQGRDMTAAIVTEHLTGNMPISGPTSSGEPGGLFEDTQSNLLGARIQNVFQTFTVTSYNYFPAFLNQSVFVRGFGGDYGTLSIVKTPTAVYINGNSGLNAQGQPNELCAK
jgi:RHS repeat-associated protein